MFWRLFHRSKIGRYIHGNEPWALVTGASDGIGKGIANELLARGCNVILHGRNASKLESVQRELEALHPRRRAATFVYDASHLGTSSSIGVTNLYTALANVLNGRRLTVLVNNVGHTTSYETVLQHSPEEMDTIMTVGMRFMTHVTRAVLPHLLDQTPALIINVTGLTAKFPAPLLAIHSGTKAYIENFSRALRIELGLMEPNHDVECIAVDVHNVSSNSNSSSPSFFTPTSEREGRAIVDVVGCGKSVVTAYWRHDLMAKALAILPQSLMDRAMASSMLEMRQRELAVERERQRMLVMDITIESKLAGVKGEDERGRILAAWASGADTEVTTPTATERSDNRGLTVASPLSTRSPTPIAPLSPTNPMRW